MKLNLDKDKKYLLACSYGPDSMCLFDLLLRGEYNFSVANVNYNLREESKQESADLKELCKNCGIEFFGLNVKEEIKSNIEEKCREIRYSFFKKIYDLNNFDALLVAHNQDDLLETYYLQKKRGGIVEYLGLQESSFNQEMNIIRPLLKYSKKFLEEYDDENIVPFSLDKSNFEDKYERNKIRHSVVSKMDKNNRNDLLKRINKENKYLLRKHNKVLSVKSNLVKDIAKFDDEDLAYFVVKESRKYFPSIEFSMSRVKEIRKVLCSKKPNIIYALTNDLSLVKSYDNFYFKRLNKETNFCFILEKPGILDTQYFYLDFIKESINRNVSMDDYPLTIRNAVKDDEINIKDYHTTMRREFINWKMPLELRNRWPVIENKDHKIVYVPRYQKDFKLTDDLNFYVKI